MYPSYPVKVGVPSYLCADIDEARWGVCVFIATMLHLFRLYADECLHFLGDAFGYPTYAYDPVCHLSQSTARDYDMFHALIVHYVHPDPDIAYMLLHAFGFVYLVLASGAAVGLGRVVVRPDKIAKKHRLQRQQQSRIAQDIDAETERAPVGTSKNADKNKKKKLRQREKKRRV
jgi:hypothetical protein